MANFLGDTNLLPCTVLERGRRGLVDLGGLGSRPGKGPRGEGRRVRGLRPPRASAFRVAPRPEARAAAVVHQPRRHGPAPTHAGGRELQLRELSSNGGAAGQAAGATVHVGWDADKAQLLVLEG